MDRRRRAVMFLAALLALAGCSEEPAPRRADAAPPDAAADAAPAPPDAEKPWLELGMGVEEFAPLPPDAVVELVLGPQAAWMTFLALRGGGFSPEAASVELRAAMLKEPVGMLRQHRDFARADGALTAAGLTLVFDPDVTPGGMEGNDVTVDVAVLDAAGRGIAASAVIHPRPR